MKKTPFIVAVDIIVLPIIFLTLISLFILNAIYSQIFPSYYLIILLSLVVFIVFSKIDFDVFKAFSTHFYVLSIVLLVLTLVLGEISRGAVRWLGIGTASFQPSELVRPFLLLYASRYFGDTKITFKKFIKGLFLMAIPVLLVFLQPSLGVSIVLAFGFFGVLVFSQVNRRYLLSLLIFIGICIPAFWFLMQPYQKTRIFSFLGKDADKLGANYNSIQSMITVGSGGFYGRGLGKGVQTQLAFLPEKHSDFIFASISEELGFFGASTVMILLFFILFRISSLITRTNNQAYRLYVVGALFMLLIETFIHIGMNVGILPITGIPLPFVSAGGSAYLANSILVAICLSGKKS